MLFNTDYCIYLTKHIVNFSSSKVKTITLQIDYCTFLHRSRYVS